MPRTRVRYEQIRRRGAPNVDASDAPFTEGRYFDAGCLASLAVNDCVVVISEVAGVPQVEKADPSDPTHTPAVGIVVEKATSTTCLVQVSGLVTSLSGLTVGDQYYVGAAGTPVNTPPAAPTLQIVGAAIGAAKLLLFPNQFDVAMAGTYDFLLDCEPVSENNTYAVTRTLGVVTKETWTSNVTSNTIKTIDYTRAGGVLTVEVVKVFASDGTTIVAQKTVTYSRIGGQVVGASITRDV